MNPRERESKLRLEIRKRQEHLGAILNRLQCGGAMIQGSVYVRRRRCGKPRCRCVRGHLHKDRVLAVRRGGRVAVRSLDPIEDAATEEAVAACRLFRRDRGELAGAYRGLVQAVDRLGRLRQAEPGRLR